MTEPADIGENLAAALVAAGAVATALVVWAIVRLMLGRLAELGRLPTVTGLVIALSILTTLAIGAALVADSGEPWAIAAAGIGALAGSVTASFRGKDDPPS